MNFVKLGANFLRVLPNFRTVTSNFHIFSPRPPLGLNSALLSPKSPNLVQNCGFKVKGQLRLRCKDCYMVRRQERWHVICKTHPRHKQMQMIKDPKNTWVLSHATQGKVRPW